jgi:signal transduction histidine kinase
VHLLKIFRTATFRLASVYAVLFAASVAILGVIAYFIITVTLERRLDAQVAGEMALLLQAFGSGGVTGLEAQVSERERTHPNGSLRYMVVDDHGDRRSGNLSIMPPQTGWSDIEVMERDGVVRHFRSFISSFAGGRVAVAADRDEVDEAEGAVLYGFVSAFGGIVLLGITGGIVLSLAFLNRVEAIRRTAEAISAGDLSRRVPLRGTGDDLDRLSHTLNQMLDRIAELMESLKQISADIAHDLKTPLTRLRQRLDLAGLDTASLKVDRTLAEDAVEGIDGILATFNALLRIAQIEARTRRSGFREFDLSEAFTTVVDAFAPSADELGRNLSSQIAPDVHIRGDRELLTQMLANVVENAIYHTPAGTRIEVSLHTVQAGVVASVVDNGPGVPEGERDRIFRRLYRLEQSRSTPGSGLGLSLVRAVADLHDISLEVQDAQPGFRMTMKFPTAGNSACPPDGMRGTRGDGGTVSSDAQTLKRGKAR